MPAVKPSTASTHWPKQISRTEISASDNSRALSPSRADTWGDALAGALAGAAATAPMTMVMTLIHRALPARQQHALPPQKIVEDVTHALGLRKQLDSPQKQPLIWTAHYAYGAMMGGILGACSRPATNVTDASLKGMAFGMGVWAANYLAAVPAAGFRPSAKRESLGRNAMMIGAHLTWGAAFGICDALLNQRRTPQPPRGQI